MNGTSFSDDGYVVPLPGAAPPTTTQVQLAGIRSLSTIALVVSNEQQVITLFNRGAEELFGYHEHEVHGQPLALLFPQLDDQAPSALVANVQLTITGRHKRGTLFSTTAEITQQDTNAGPWHTILLRKTDPLMNPLGGLNDRASLLHFVQDAVITTDMTLHITGWNHAAETLYGWAAAEVLGQTSIALLQTAYLDSNRAQVLHELETYGMWRGEIIHNHRDGHAITIMAAAATVYKPTGEPLGIVSINRDITDRKRAEYALQRSVERLKVLADASHTFADVATDERAVLDCVAAIAATPLRAGCIIRLLSDDGQWLPVVTVYDQDPTVREAVLALAAHNRVHINDPNPIAAVTRSGQPLFLPTIDPESLRELIPPELWEAFIHFHPHSTIIIPLRAHGQILGSLLFSRYLPAVPAFTEDDMTLAQDLADRAALAISSARLFTQLEIERVLLARRVAERTADLSRANAELAHAARLKDEFLANMSHELRTPLNSILSRAEAIEEAIYGPVTAKQIEMLHGVVESGQHLLTLINDILDLSKIEAGQLELQREPLNMSMLCNLSLRMIMQTALIKRVDLTANLDGMVQIINADERRLKQILVNLLSNAVKFTPTGGKMGLDVRGNAEQQTVTFTVWDTGIGIDPEALPRLFRPFVQIDNRLSRQHEGTGLGLALVMRLTEAHGGSVAVESVPGQGSRFSITLPWNPADQAADPLPATAAINMVSPAFRQALVIEDSATAAEQIARYLRELGTQVEILPYGTGTIERAIALQPDVIILDILLPDEDGWEVLRRLKAEPRTQAIPVIIVSVVDAPARGRELGAAALLCKPIARETLVQTLRSVTTSKVEPSAQIALVVAAQPLRPRVLIAEDNQANIDSLFDFLQVKGYRVTVARNGNEALMYAQEERPDVILMDIQMPGMDGLEAIRRIRADPHMGTVPIIAVTALAMPGDLERCLSAGADDYLTKPVHLRALLTTIEAHLQRRTQESRPT